MEILKTYDLGLMNIIKMNAKFLYSRKCFWGEKKKQFLYVSTCLCVVDLPPFVNKLLKELTTKRAPLPTLSNCDGGELLASLLHYAARRGRIN